MTMNHPALSKFVFYHQVGFSLWDIREERMAEIQRLFPDIQCINTTDIKNLAREIVDADALCAMRITGEVFHAAKKLRWIHSLAAGIGGLIIPPVLKSDVLITNARGVFSPVMAEHTLGMILAFSRRLLDSSRFQQRHEWARDALWELHPPMGEISGKTLAIIGYGSIGLEIAKRACAFGMRILAVKKNPALGVEFADQAYPPSLLHDVLRQSDFVVLALPHTPETKNLMGEAEFRSMKPTAYLINVGRGKLIDETALLRALHENRLAGAGLDVFSTEPLPPEHPFWDEPHLLITPHSSAYFPEFWPRSLSLIAENIRRFRMGQTLLNLVDKNRGY